MVTTMTSFTSDKTYELTETTCTCGDFQFRGSKLGKPCKHLIAQEIAKAERFLAIKAQIEQQEIERRENRQSYERMMAAPW